MQQSLPQQSTSKAVVIENHGGHQWYWQYVDVKDDGFVYCKCSKNCTSKWNRNSKPKSNIKTHISIKHSAPPKDTPKTL